jgi:hypothetical protein
MFPRVNEGSGAPTGARVLARHPFRAGQYRRPARPRADQLSQSARRDARLSALHRGDLLAPSPPWPFLGALHMSGAPWSDMGAFARPARSGGWAVLLGRLPGARLRAVHAGRRIPLRLWLVSGDALGERDSPYVGARRNCVKEKMPSTTYCRTQVNQLTSGERTSLSLRDDHRADRRNAPDHDAATARSRCASAAKSVQ